MAGPPLDSTRSNDADRHKDKAKLPHFMQGRVRPLLYAPTVDSTHSKKIQAEQPTGMNKIAADSCSDHDDESRLPPLRLGVFGGSFSPCHLGHVLLAVTTQQTKPIDELLMVPVFKHARKTNLLPFEDRVEMCKLAIAPFASTSGGVSVCSIEREVGASNAPMLRAIKRKYQSLHSNRKIELYWICGDDVFTWIEKPKGVETMAEVSGLIVQRRLHKGNTKDVFYKEALDETKIREIGMRLDLAISFIYGELPHFSSTLVRNAPGRWRSFLPQSVASYLEARPELLAKLYANLEIEAAKEKATLQPERKKQKLDEDAASIQAPTYIDNAANLIIRGLDVVHQLQFERGQTGLLLSIGSDTLKEKLKSVQSNTDFSIRDVGSLQDDDLDCLDEAEALRVELRLASSWLQRDRAVIEKRYIELKDLDGEQAWLARHSIVSKFNSRIDVIFGCIIRSLQEIIDIDGHVGKNVGATTTSPLQDAPDLLLTWHEGKEALGRLRAFVCSGGRSAPDVIKKSLNIRQLLHNVVDSKNRMIERIVALGEHRHSPSDPGAQYGASTALHRLLEEVSLFEWLLMGSFAPSTPLPLMHKLLSEESNKEKQFDVERFFFSASAAIDLMLSETKALAAFGCTKA